MSKQELINQLLEIAFTDGDGTQWRETRTRKGKQETRTIKPCAAAGAAFRLMTGAADAALQAKAREIIALAQWHKPGAADE